MTEFSLEPDRGASPSSLLADALAIARYHIVFVAVAGAITFGWLMKGAYPFAIGVVVAVDWFLINLMNRVTDVDEDIKNGIVGTERVARARVSLTAGAWALMVASFVASSLVWPALTPWRAAVQLIGLGYNYKIVPTLRGLSRFKEIYFFKNFGSAVLFVLTCFVYPLVAGPGARAMRWEGIATLAVFFVLFELTYEIIYDLRDIEGDRAERVPTYPVVHGPARARQIIDGLLVAAASVLVLGFIVGWIGVRELLMVAAPALQWLYYRPRYDRGLSARDCVAITHLGTTLLVVYLIGTAVWLRLGLPPNVTLPIG